MGKMQRDKGARYERELAARLREYGYESRRTCQKDGAVEPDVIGLPGIHIEAKHQEKMHLYDWMEQAVRDAGKTGGKPVVMHKQNYKETLVTMRFDDWMELYQEWEAGN